MNFYIGNLINDINMQDVNVEFSDELINYICKLNKPSCFDMSKLYKIDPYHDIEIAKEDLPEIICCCQYILGMSLLKNYKEKDEGEEMLYNLLELAQKALKRNLGYSPEFGERIILSHENEIKIANRMAYKQFLWIR